MKRHVFLLAAILAAGAASAQDAFDFRVADLALLQAKQVQTELKVTAAQRAKMNVAAETYKSHLEAYAKTLKALGTPKPDEGRVRAMQAQIKKDVFAVLTPGQLRRLRELTLQRIGLISLTDPEVAKRVGLSSGEVAKLKTTFEAGRTRFQTAQKSFTDPILAPYRTRKPKDAAEAASMRKEIMAKLKAAEPAAKPKLEAVGKATNDAMLAVLSPAEKAKWAALKGPPFKGQ